MGQLAKGRERTISSEADLLLHDSEVDREVCGVSLFVPDKAGPSRQGAHNSSPTYYFVLEELFAHLDLDGSSHLLDVGCGKGRVLAHFLRQGLPGQATGIELDPDMAAIARSWTSSHANLHVLEGSVLDLDLGPYTHLYLYNPFDPNVLGRFIDAVEAHMAHPCTVIHMSDNGDTWWYLGRPGWTELDSGEFLCYRNSRGREIRAFECPQHYTIWRYDPPSRD